MTVSLDVMDLPVPYDVDAERWVLGSILYDDKAMVAVDPLLEPGDFYLTTHQQIYAAIQALYRAQPRQACSYGAVTLELGQRGQLTDVGGDAYLVGLWSNVPTGIHAAHFANVVLEYAEARAMITAGGRIAGLGYTKGLSGAARAEEAEKLLLSVTQRRKRGVPAQTLQSARIAYLQDLEARMAGAVPVPGWTTGIGRLDTLLGGGLRPRKLYVVIGEPGGGKSTFGMAVALAALQAGARVGFYSLEMGADELAELSLAHDAEVDSALMAAGAVSREEYQRLCEAEARRRDQAPFQIVTGGGFTYRDIAAQARTWQTEPGGLDMLAIDYLGLVKTAGKSENRVNELDALVDDLKALSMELNIPVLTFSQISREGRKLDPDEWKQFTRGTAGIEQTADVVMAVAPQGEKPAEGTTPWPMKIIVSKQRRGPTGTVDALWWLAYSRIGEVTHRYDY